MSSVVEKKEFTVMDRTPGVIAAEIRSIDMQTREFVLRSAVEIGKKLAEAKELVPHGEWGKWLEQNVSYSQSTANNFMRISTEYDTNSQTLANLSYSKAVALLGLPAGEREAFVENNEVETMSSRELQAAIREKKELERQLMESQKVANQEREAREALAASVAEYETKKREYDQEMSSLKTDLENARLAKDDKAVERAQEQLRKVQQDLNEEKQRVKELQEELKKIPIDVPKIEVPEETKRELADLRRKEEAATKQISEMKELLDKNNKPAVIKVEVCFDNLVSHFKDLLAAIGEVQDVEERQKLEGAIIKLCDKMKDVLQQ